MSDPANDLWETLAISALLGTERRPFELPTSTDNPLSAALAAIQQQHSGDPQHLILASAATLSLYRNAGWLPIHDDRPLAAPCPPETLSPCSQRAGHHLYSMLSSEFGPALFEWLEAAAKYGRIVPYDYLPSLLDLGQAQPAYRPTILPVIGNRGRWLASLYTEDGDWDYVRNAAVIETPDEESTIALWETGSLEARFAVLREMRTAQPDRARDLLISVWKQENAKTRAALVRTLEVNLSMQDEPFLESVLDDRSSDVVQAATKHLVRLPESRFLQRTIVSTESALKISRVKQNKLFGLGQSADKSTIEITLPEEYTPAMKRDQIIQKTSAPAFGDRAYWLLQQISRTPPHFWSERLQADPQVIIAAALRTKEWKSLLMQSFMSATELHSDSAWAEGFLAQGIGTFADYSLNKLVSLLAPERRNQLIANTLITHPEALYTNDLPLDLLWTLQKPWPIDVCRAVLNSVAHHIKNNTPKNSYWQVSQSLSTFAYSMPPAIYPEAERALFTNESTSANIKAAVDEFLTTLKFRQDMLTALAQ